MRKLYFFLIAILFTACIKNSYPAKSRTEAKSIDVYPDESAIKKNYLVVGKTYMHREVIMCTPENIIATALTEARRKGADAVLITDHLVATAGTSAAMQTDTSSKVAITRDSLTTQQKISTGFTVLFLKYTK